MAGKDKLNNGRKETFVEQLLIPSEGHQPSSFTHSPIVSLEKCPPTTCHFYSPHFASIHFFSLPKDQVDVTAWFYQAHSKTERQKLCSYHLTLGVFAVCMAVLISVIIECTVIALGLDFSFSLSIVSPNSTIFML